MAIHTVRGRGAAARRTAGGACRAVRAGGTMPAMTEPTHATIATFRLDMSREDEQRRGLHEFLVPRVSQHPGFLGGNWMLDRDAEESVVVITFSSRDTAEAFRENVEGNAGNQAASAIELLTIRVVEVTASA